MLTYQVKNLIANPGSSFPVEESISLEDLTVGGEGIHFLSPVKVSGTLSSIGGGVIRFDGTADAAAAMECSRCTKSTQVSLHSDITQRFVGDRSEEEAEAEDAEVYTNDMIDLNDLIYSEISMAVPMKVLCRPDCKGLCPVCGKDLNDGPCDCQQENTDPRWDALKNLLHQ